MNRLLLISLLFSTAPLGAVLPPAPLPVPAAQAADVNHALAAMCWSFGYESGWAYFEGRASVYDTATYYHAYTYSETAAVNMERAEYYRLAGVSLTHAYFLGRVSALEQLAQLAGE